MIAAKKNEYICVYINVYIYYIIFIMMTFHLEDFWEKSPSPFVSAFVWGFAKVLGKAHGDWKEYNFVHHGKQLGWQAPAVGCWFRGFFPLWFFRGRTSHLTGGTWRRRRKEHLDLENQKKGPKLGIWNVLTLQKYSNCIFYSLRIYEYCVFVSFVLPPPLKKNHLSQHHASSLTNQLGHLWSTNRHTQGMTLAHTKLHEFWDHFRIFWSPKSEVSQFYNIQYSGIIPDIQYKRKIYIVSLWSSEIIYK